MSPSTSPLTTATTTTASTARPASPGYRLLTPSELSKILNQHHPHNSQASTSLIPTLPIASSSSSLTATAVLAPPTSIASLHHHHLQPPSFPNHAPKPLIPSSTPLTPEGSTPTSSFLTGMNIPIENDGSILTSSGGNSTQDLFNGVVGGGGQDLGKLSGATTATTTATLPSLVDESRRTLCVRHQSMADQGINGKLQQSLDALPMSERAAITSLWSTFSSSPHPKRKIILEGILTMCCFSQLSHLSESLSQIIRVDPFSLFPKEVSLKVLGFLDAISLGKAAQVSRGWRELADDDLLWRRMCGQHIERKCTRCGWGLPLLERRRLRMEEQGRGDEVLGSGQAVGGSLNYHHHHGHHHQHSPPSSHHHHRRTAHVHHAAQHAAHQHRDEVGMSSEQSSSIVDHQLESVTTTPRGGSRGEKRRGEVELKEGDLMVDGSSGVKRRRIDARDASCPTQGGKMMTETSSDSEISDIGLSRAVTSMPTITTAIVNSTSSGLTTRSGSTLAPPIPSPARTTRRKPWKHVYCERLMVERNWRKGRPIERILKGHTNGVMCLQVQHNLSTPSYPVLITGSYDKTVKVWNLDTGEVVRTLVGHTRSVKTLQFDQAMLVTGSADKTLRVWNWRTGECLRVLEGHTKDVMCLHYDRNTLASGSADATVKIWNMKTGSCFVLRGHTDMVNSVSLWDGRTSPADRAFNSIVDSPVSANVPMQSAAKFLFSASDDGTIKMWDLASKSCLRTYAGHTGQIQSIRVLVVDKEADAHESDEDAARSGGRRGRSVSHMDDYGGETVSSNSTAGPISCSANFAPFQPGNATASRHELPIDLAADLPADKQALLVSGALDNTIKVWDVETGLEKSTLFGHIEGVWAVDVDSLRMASASHDRTIKIWDRETGRCARTLVGHRGAVTSLQLSDDMIVSGSEDGEVRVWSFAPAPTNNNIIQPASYTPPAISTPATSI